MKSLINIWIFLIGICLVAGCTENQLVETNNSLEWDQAQVVSCARSVFFRFGGDTLDQPMIWKVTPAENAEIYENGGTAYIAFNQPGDYVVSASNSKITQTAKITMKDSGCSKDSISRVTSFPESNELIITAAILDSIGYPSIKLTTSSNPIYKCGGAKIQFDYSGSADLIKIDYLGVYQDFRCTGGAYRAEGNYPIIKSMPNKTTNLEISISGNTYKGTITSDGTSFTIELPDNPHVRFEKEFIKN